MGKKKTWRASLTHCFQRLMQIMLWFPLIWFCFAVEEQRGTKWITQGELTQEMRQWWVRAGDETDWGTEQSLTGEWKSTCQRVMKVHVHPSSFLCLWRLFRPCGSASVWVTHTRRSGSVHSQDGVLCQGRGYSLRICLSRHLNDGLGCAFASCIIEWIAYRLARSQRSCRSQRGLAEKNYASSYTRGPDGAVMSQKTNTSLYFPFSLLMYCTSAAIYWCLTGQLAPAAVD